MIQSIKKYLSDKNIPGDIILYRDKSHKKKAMCEYLASKIETDKIICVHSVGAFGLYTAKAFPNNLVMIFGDPSEEYLSQIRETPNARVSKKGMGNFVKKDESHFINQFNEPIIEEYYTAHFVKIMKDVGAVDAFCDCGHSCATLSGAIKSGMNLCYILGTVKPTGRKYVHYLSDKIGQFTQEYAGNFDTKQIQIDIESMYPKFGNIFEATRSISAAMSWLQKNPNKTVLVYVGDSPVFGEDKTI